MREVRFAIAALLGALLLFAPVVAQQDDEASKEPPNRREQPEERTEVLRLANLDTKSAVTVARSIGQIRQIAELPRTRTLVIRSDPATVKETIRLLKEVDVSMPVWTLDVVLATDDGQRLLRQIDIEEESLQLEFGSNGTNTGHVSILLYAEPLADELHAAYEIAVHLPGGDEILPLRFTESGEATIGNGDRLDVVDPMLPAHRTALARILGLDLDAGELCLQFRHN